VHTFTNKAILKKRGKQTITVIDTHGDPLGDGAFDFTHDLPRLVGVPREDQDEGTAGLDAFDDGGTPLLARGDVARGDPAAEPFRLQGGHRRVGHRPSTSSS